jgi:hypothetical protein
LKRRIDILKLNAYPHGIASILLSNVHEFVGDGYCFLNSQLAVHIDAAGADVYDADGKRPLHRI